MNPSDFFLVVAATWVLCSAGWMWKEWADAPTYDAQCGAFFRALPTTVAGIIVMLVAVICP